MNPIWILTKNGSLVNLQLCSVIYVNEIIVNGSVIYDVVVSVQGPYESKVLSSFSFPGQADSYIKKIGQYFGTLISVK